MNAPTNSPPWPNAVRKPCEHHDARPAGAEVCLLVVHSIALPPGEYGGSAVIDFFGGNLDYNAHPYYEKLRDLRVSAHFFIRRDGEIIQFVDIERRAWHAGESSWRGRSACNDFSVGVELEGDEKDSYTDSQYDSLAALSKAAAARYPGLYITGHSDIAPGRKSDPGPLFDWARLFAMVGEQHDGR